MTWIRNTSRHPDDEVRELVRFATRGIDMRRVCVNVKGGRGLSARAYDGVPSVSNAPRGALYLVTIKVGNGVRYPLGPHNRNGRSPAEVGPSSLAFFLRPEDLQENGRDDDRTPNDPRALPRVEKADRDDGDHQHDRPSHPGGSSVPFHH